MTRLRIAAATGDTGQALVRVARAAGHAVVFSRLGTTRAKAKAAAARGESATDESVDRDLRRMLHAAATASPTPPRVVVLGSLGADHPGGKRYLQARAAARKALAAGARPWTSARPSFITGPDREESRPAERIGAMLGDGAPRLLSAIEGTRPRARTGAMDATTLAPGLLRGALDPAAAGRTIEAEGLRPR